MYVDLGLEREVIAAERGTEKIAVEIQSFTGRSPLNDLHHALGQYLVYRSALKDNRVDRRLYLAISSDSYDWIWQERIGEIVRIDYQVRLIIFDTRQEGALQWIEPLNTAIS
jgi:XisH protein